MSFLGTYRNFVRSLIKPPVLPSIVDEHNRVDIIENFRLTLSNYYFFVLLLSTLS